MSTNTFKPYKPITGHGRAYPPGAAAAPPRTASCVLNEISASTRTARCALWLITKLTNYATPNARNDNKKARAMGF